MTSLGPLAGGRASGNEKLYIPQGVESVRKKILPGFYREPFASGPPGMALAFKPWEKALTAEGGKIYAKRFVWSNPFYTNTRE